METEVHLWSLALIGQHNGFFSMRYVCTEAEETVDENAI